MSRAVASPRRIRQGSGETARSASRDLFDTEDAFFVFGSWVAMMARVLHLLGAGRTDAGEAVVIIVIGTHYWAAHVHDAFMNAVRVMDTAGATLQTGTLSCGSSCSRAIRTNDACDKHRQFKNWNGSIHSDRTGDRAPRLTCCYLFLQPYLDQ